MVTRKSYSKSFKLKVLRDYVESGKSRQEISLKYSIDPTLISHWVRIFGVERTHFADHIKLVPMRASKTARELAMEQRIRDLERILKKKDEELAFEKLRCRAMDTLIDVAEEQLHIQIRKKAGTKQ